MREEPPKLQKARGRAEEREEDRGAKSREPLWARRARRREPPKRLASRHRQHPSGKMRVAETATSTLGEEESC